MRKFGVNEVCGFYAPSLKGREIAPHFYKKNGYELVKNHIVKYLDPKTKNKGKELNIVYA